MVVLDFRFSVFRFPLPFVILTSASLTHHRPPSSFPPMSRLPFELLLALRYLRPKRTFVSVITLISVVGVTLGVAVLIIVISVMSGFDQQLRDKILGFNAHLRITNAQDTISNYAELIRLLRKNPHVTGAAPGVLGQVLLETEPQNGNPLVAAPWIRGIDPSYETNVSIVHTSIIEGSDRKSVV